MIYNKKWGVGGVREAAFPSSWETSVVQHLFSSWDRVRSWKVCFWNHQFHGAETQKRGLFSLFHHARVLYPTASATFWSASFKQNVSLCIFPRKKKKKESRNGALETLVASPLPPSPMWIGVKTHSAGRKLFVPQCTPGAASPASAARRKDQKLTEVGANAHWKSTSHLFAPTPFWAVHHPRPRGGHRFLLSFPHPQRQEENSAQFTQQLQDRKGRTHPATAEKRMLSLEKLNN